ncbi:MAG TPA: LamG domain-containing protein, partial [Thermoprotei archaeon]|nr:LamG domain-containing protein [Thermoprotei archaeon]
MNGKPVLCFDSRFNLKLGKWYHLVVTVSDQGNTAYLNGVELTDRHYNFGSPKMRLFLADIPSKELLAIGLS